MSAATDPTIVLKFGSSVLDGPAGFRQAAEQIQSELEQGRRVCAVVSATPGTTDRLWRASHDLALAPRPDLISSVLATGEQASVYLLGVALDARGLAPLLYGPEALGLRTAGPPLDARPIGIDSVKLQKDLGAAGVVVVPGFVGRGAAGKMTVLGRGGSDLTALFIAHALGARCCLVKDVDGLYDGDPNGGQHPAPRRYVQACWDELARVGNTVVQNKAVSFARHHRLSFRIAARGRQGTEIGPGPNVLERVAS